MNAEERKSLIERYSAGYQEVIKALDGFPAHLADSESTSAIRLRRLLVEDKPLIQGYDQDQFASKLRYNERDMAPSLEAFRAARATTAQLLSLMSEEEWRREGVHNESGRYTAEDWLVIYAAHAHNHAAQIQRLRDTLNT